MVEEHKHIVPSQMEVGVTTVTALIPLFTTFLHIIGLSSATFLVATALTHFESAIILFAKGQHDE